MSDDRLERMAHDLANAVEPRISAEQAAEVLSRGLVSKWPVDTTKARHCRVYWGSHGCDLERGHKGHHDCGCCECEDHPDPDSGCVGRFPYYGRGTWFYGEDAPWQPLVNVIHYIRSRPPMRRWRRWMLGRRGR